MLISENDIGKIFINLDVMKNIITNFISRFDCGKLLNVGINKKIDNVFYIHFKYADCNVPKIASEMKNFSKKVKKFILDCFAIQHLVIITEMGF